MVTLQAPWAAHQLPGRGLATLGHQPSDCRAGCDRPGSQRTHSLFTASRIPFQHFWLLPGCMTSGEPSKRSSVWSRCASPRCGRGGRLLLVIWGNRWQSARPPAGPPGHRRAALLPPEPPSVMCSGHTRRVHSGRPFLHSTFLLNTLPFKVRWGRRRSAGPP